MAPTARPGWRCCERPGAAWTLGQLEQLLAAVDGDVFTALMAHARQAHADARLVRLCAGLEPSILGAERGWPLWQRVERAWLRLAGPAIYPEPAERLDAHRFIDTLALHEEPESLAGEAMCMPA